MNTFLMHSLSDFDTLKRRHIASLQGNFNGIVTYRDEQLQRAKAWSQTHHWDGAGWRKLEE